MILRPNRRLAPVAAAALLLAAVSPTSAQDRPVREPGRVTVSGRATIEAPPDVATVTIGVSAKSATAGGAIDETSAAATRIIAAVAAFGIPKTDIWTSQVSLQQAWKSVRDGAGMAQRQPDGFEASNNVQVRLRDLGRVGEFLRRGIGEGATRIDGLSFGLVDPGKSEREAGAAAATDAQLRAEAVAAASGVRLGRIVSIRWGGARAPVPTTLRGFSSEARAAPPVPIEPGQLAVSAEVEITWAIEPAP